MKDLNMQQKTNLELINTIIHLIFVSIDNRTFINAYNKKQSNSNQLNFMLLILT